jgi:hypothetical protein
LDATPSGGYVFLSIPPSVPSYFVRKYAHFEKPKGSLEIRYTQPPGMDPQMHHGFRCAMDPTGKLTYDICYMQDCVRYIRELRGKPETPWTPKEQHDAVDRASHLLSWTIGDTTNRPMYIAVMRQIARIGYPSADLFADAVVQLYDEMAESKGYLETPAAALPSMVQKLLEKSGQLPPSPSDPLHPYPVNEETTRQATP